MKNILKLEELAEFVFGILIFSRLEFAWWYFPLKVGKDKD